MNKHHTKKSLQILASQAITYLIGRMPRAQLRLASQAYANETRRIMEGLPRKNYKVNQEVIRWIIREYDNATSLAAMGSGEDDQGSPAAGPTERTPEVSMRIIDESGAAEL
jgi:hypothetical protein